MRVIEQRMNAAILANRDWRSGNTSVTNVDGVSFVHLHGNLIAEVGDNFIVLHDGGWQSNTTKSRLNAILRVHGCEGESVFQKKFEWFVNFKNHKGDIITIPFFSGMRMN